MNVRASLAVIATAAFSSVAFASEGGGHEGHGIPWSTLAFSAVNFSIFAYFVVGRGIVPSLRRWAADRRDAVVAELERASRARIEAERLRAEWEARVKNVEREVEDLRRQAMVDAELERERILAAAKKTVEVIAADARRLASQEVARVEEELREELAREAIAIAERLIREHLTPEDQRRFVGEFLQQVRS